MDDQDNMIKYFEAKGTSLTDEQLEALKKAGVPNEMMEHMTAVAGQIATAFAGMAEGLKGPEVGLSEDQCKTMLEHILDEFTTRCLKGYAAYVAG